MKTRSELLSNFIKDFDLENTDHSVCFIASVEFRANGIFKKMDTEIHLVTFKLTGLSALYLLDPVILSENIPDIISYSDEHFLYTKNKFLSIREKSPVYGEYTLNIFPIKKICYPETMKEIRLKEMN